MDVKERTESLKAGKLSQKEILEFFCHVIKTGECWKDPEYLGVLAADYINNGLITDEGELTKAGLIVNSPAKPEAFSNNASVLMKILGEKLFNMAVIKAVMVVNEKTVELEMIALYKTVEDTVQMAPLAIVFKDEMFDFIKPKVTDKEGKEVKDVEVPVTKFVINYVEK